MGIKTKTPLARLGKPFIYGRGIVDKLYLEFDSRERFYPA